MTCGDDALTIDCMNRKTSSTGAMQRAARVVAPTGGAAGLGGLAWAAGMPSAFQFTLWSIAGALGIGTAVNSAIARGRRQQTSARHHRTSTDDHAHLVVTRSRIRNLLADPTMTGARRRELERTYRELTLEH